MGGLGLALIAFLLLGITGVADATAGAAALIFLQYSAQIAAGYIGGRMAGQSRVVHGGLAGLAMAALGAAIGLGFSATDTDVGLIVLALFIALTTGSAGGALAQYLQEGRLSETPPSNEG
ncbi:MAG: hypothetical protein HKN91_06450 [Acidimicrobiia bacterium]|nr:hypothetical protein [Acidimicrobiia bacterium]